jgi:hypothetical protein
MESASDAAHQRIASYASGRRSYALRHAVKIWTRRILRILQRRSSQQGGLTSRGVASRPAHAALSSAAWPRPSVSNCRPEPVGNANPSWSISVAAPRSSLRRRHNRKRTRDIRRSHNRTGNPNHRRLQRFPGQRRVLEPPKPVHPSHRRANRLRATHRRQIRRGSRRNRGRQTHRILAPTQRLGTVRSRGPPIGRSPFYATYQYSQK